MATPADNIGMSMHPLRIAAAFAAALLPAQDPTPTTGGDATVWSTSEGRAYAEVLRLAANAHAGRPLRMPAGGLQLPDYRVLLYAADGDGLAAPAAETSDVAPWVLLAWPNQRTDDTRRAILLHHDGMAMFTDLAQDDRSDPSADCVVGKGTEGRFADAVRAPGTSASGHLWLWMTQAGRPVRVEVKDEHGKPVTQCEVVLRPATGEEQIEPVLLPEGPWPVGRAAVDAGGKARVQGPRCNHLAVEVQLREGNHVVRTGFAAAAEGDGLRVVLTAAAIRRSRTLANEFAAIATLKNISSAQAQCQACGIIDTDGDGAGEYGYFAEMTGAQAVRGADRKMQPPVLSQAFARLAKGRAERNGYLFAIFLCDKDGSPLAEKDAGGAPAGVDADKAEACWCAYAWPASAATGVRAFFVNQQGDVLACANDELAYAGHDKAPAPTAAFAPGKPLLTAAIAANRDGQDGRRWRVVP